MDYGYIYINWVSNCGSVLLHYYTIKGYEVELYILCLFPERASHYKRLRGGVVYVISLFKRESVPL